MRSSARSRSAEELDGGARPCGKRFDSCANRRRGSAALERLNQGNLLVAVIRRVAEAGGGGTLSHPALSRRRSRHRRTNVRSFAYNNARWMYHPDCFLQPFNDSGATSMTQKRGEHDDLHFLRGLLLVGCAALGADSRLGQERVARLSLGLDKLRGLGPRSKSRHRGAQFPTTASLRNYGWTRPSSTSPREKELQGRFDHSRRTRLRIFASNLPGLHRLASGGRARCQQGPSPVVWAMKSPGFSEAPRLRCPPW